jgi:hypothetical protein
MPYIVSPRRTLTVAMETSEKISWVLGDRFALDQPKTVNEVNTALRD